MGFVSSPGEYLFGVGGFWRGDCGDFVTLGDLTFWGSGDTMHGKITRPRHIYKVFFPQF